MVGLQQGGQVVIQGVQGLPCGAPILLSGVDAVPLAPQQLGADISHVRGQHLLKGIPWLGIATGCARLPSLLDAPSSRLDLG